MVDQCIKLKAANEDLESYITWQVISWGSLFIYIIVTSLSVVCWETIVFLDLLSLEHLCDERRDSENC